jgi:hypothetical protein
MNHVVLAAATVTGVLSPTQRCTVVIWMKTCAPGGTIYHQITHDTDDP